MAQEKAIIARQWLTAKEVGERFGYPANTVRQGAAGFDDLPRAQFGRDVRYNREDVELFEERRRREAQSLKDVREAIFSPLLSHVGNGSTSYGPADRRRDRKR